MMKFDGLPDTTAPFPQGAPRPALAALTEAIAAVTAITGYPAAEPAVPIPSRAHRLGSLSERYESGGRGPGTVSSVLREPGGVSYGLYQLASRTGTVAAFMAAEGARWSRRFIGREPGTRAFSEAWQAVADSEPDAFAEAEHAFIERTHYRPAVQAVQAQTGLQLDSRANAVRDACWSCAVQHGGAAKLLARAVSRADALLARDAAEYDRALVNAIYDERCEYVRKIAERADPGTRRTLRDLADKRYPSERAAALSMLAAQA